MPITAKLSSSPILLPQETLDRINALLAENPDLRYHYYGEDFGSNIWVSSGITPVPGQVVIYALKSKGIDVSDIEKVVDELIRQNAEREMKRMKLIASARSKLTAEEIEACHL